jgi:hypothetical protein
LELEKARGFERIVSVVGKRKKSKAEQGKKRST